MIKIKSRFGFEPKAVTREGALDFARHLFFAIQGRMTDEEKVAHVNKRIDGIQFVLEELKK